MDEEEEDRTYCQTTVHQIYPFVEEVVLLLRHRSLAARVNLECGRGEEKRGGGGEKEDVKTSQKTQSSIGVSGKKTSEMLPEVISLTRLDDEKELLTAVLALLLEAEAAEALPPPK